MGGQTSRTLTVKNEQPMVHVTRDVIERIRSSNSTATYLPPASSSSSVQHPPQSKTSNYSEEQGQPGKYLLRGGEHGPILETVTAYQVRQQMEEEMRNNDDFWKSKLRDLESRYVTSVYVSQEAFNEELSKMQKLIPPQRETICLENSSAVASCYNRHPSQVLKCSAEVESFAQCVRSKTTQLHTGGH